MKWIFQVLHFVGLYQQEKLTGRIKIDQQKDSHWAATEIDIQCFIFGTGCSNLNIKEVSKLLEKDSGEHYPERVLRLHRGT